MDIFPIVIPINKNVYVDGTRLYKVRCLYKKNIHSFDELSTQAKRSIRDYYFGRLLGNKSQTESVLREFGTYASGFASYLELRDVDLNDFVIPAIVCGEFDERHIERFHNCSLFFSCESVSDMDLNSHKILIDASKDDMLSAIDMSITYEPLRVMDVIGETKDYCAFEMFSRSYLKAAEYLCSQIKVLREGDAPRGVFVVRSYSLALPFVQCCRLAVELIIKSALHRLDVFSSDHKIHNISKLWNSFVSYIPSECIDGASKNKLKRMCKYVNFIHSVDATGNVSRYPENDLNLWLDVTFIFENLIRFSNMMQSIDYGMILKTKETKKKRSKTIRINICDSIEGYHYAR